MKSYYRIMLGRASAYAKECFEGGFIGADFDMNEDLSGSLTEQWQEFNKRYIPVFLASHPGKTKVAAGLACGALWTIAKGIHEGELVLSPDGLGSYRVGEITGGYYYVPGTALPHRRRVRWLEGAIARDAMSETMRNSLGSALTVINVTAYAVEIDSFLKAAPAPPVVVTTDPTVEDPATFAMEKHLEAFLVANWDQTELGSGYSIFEEDGVKIGQQYQTDAGPIDILAISKDRKRLLVVELKRGRASDVVVGQTLRYMGYVKTVLAEPDQTVEGAIIALDDDQKLRWALAMVPSVTFFRYEIRFRLVRT